MIRGQEEHLPRCPPHVLPHLILKISVQAGITGTPTFQFKTSSEMLEKGMAPHASILAWRNPQTEEPGELQSRGPQRVGHD